MAAEHVAWRQAVNLSTDGGLVVAACADGIIRWYRADNGRELLAFFPHANGLQWVLWTPYACYGCPPGSEQIFGWRVDRGLDQAVDFFPAARFRDKYYRPM